MLRECVRTPEMGAAIGADGRLIARHDVTQYPIRPTPWSRAPQSGARAARVLVCVWEIRHAEDLVWFLWTVGCGSSMSRLVSF